MNEDIYTMFIDQKIQKVKKWIIQKLINRVNVTPINIQQYAL